jgi:hypothetical protein
MALLPSQFQAGLTLAITATVGLYPAPVYSLEVALVSPTGRAILTSTDNGDGRHVIAATAAATAAWQPGRYDYQITAVSGDDRFHVEQGQIEILPNFAAAPSGGLDSRTPARKILDAINAMLQGVATDSARRIQVQGRELERYDLADLLKLRDTIRSEVAREESAAAVAAGLPDRRRAFVRFARP